MPAPAHLIVGRVRRAHGIRGEMVVEELTDDADAQFAVGRRLLAGTTEGEVAPLEAPPRELTIRRATRFKNGWILRFAEIPDRTTAEEWRDRYLLVPTPEVAPPAADEIFYHDLIGMRVEDLDGHELGRVRGLYEVVHGILLEIEKGGASTAMIPYGPPIVVRAELERRTLVVNPPAGLLDVED